MYPCSYHPKFSPPPESVQHRLVWRTDDTPEVIERRLEQFHSTVNDTLAVYSHVPTAFINSARNDLEIFADVADFVEGVAAKKLERMGGAAALQAIAEQVH